MTKEEHEYWVSRWPGSKEKLPVPPCLEGYMTKEQPVEVKKVSVVDKIFGYLKWRQKEKEDI